MQLFQCRMCALAVGNWAEAAADAKDPLQIFCIRVCTGCKRLGLQVVHEKAVKCLHWLLAIGLERAADARKCCAMFALAVGYWAEAAANARKCCPVFALAVGYWAEIATDA